MMHIFRALICAALLAVMASDNQRARAADFDHRELARVAVAGHIQPSYQRLHVEMSALETSVDRLCQSRSMNNLRASRHAFKKAVEARAAVEHIRFGPITKANRHERLTFWPDPKGIGRRQVRRALKTRKAGYDNPDALVKMSVALQGLTALEIVLFSKSASVLADANSIDRYRCDVARAIARNVRTIAGDLVREWAEDAAFVRNMLAPGEGNPDYLKDVEVTLELSQSYMTGLIFVRDQKIERPLGGDFGPKPKSVEYRLSAAGRDALRGNVVGLGDFYANGGLRAALTHISEERVQRGDKSFDTARTTLSEISLPLEQAVVDDVNAERMINLSLALSGARSAVGKGISLAAGLSLGFNAGDGD